MLACHLHAIAGAYFLIADQQRTAVGRKSAGQDLHQGGFTRAVMADQPQALSGLNTQVDVTQGTNSAKRFADTLEGYQRSLKVRHDILLGIAAHSGAAHAGQ